MRSSTTRVGRLSAVLLALLAVPLSACQLDAPKPGPSATASASPSASAPEPVVVVESLSGKTTAIKLAPGFVKALTTRDVKPGTFGSAKLVGASLIFPVTGGNLRVFEPGAVSPYVIGQIQHEGSGLLLSNSGVTVRLSNFNVDPSVSRIYGDVAVQGEIVATSAFLFQLDGRTLEPLATEDDVAVLAGTEVKLSRDAAKVLNKSFDTEDVKRGLTIGFAKITIKTS